MRMTINLDPDAYSFTSAYAEAKGMTLSAAISELRSHVHHQIVTKWFYRSPNLPWDTCVLTEAGFLRSATAPMQAR